MNTLTKSGLVVVTADKPQPTEKFKWWDYIPCDEYNRLHRACPKCGNHPLRQTTEGCICTVVNGENCWERNAKLGNRCMCKCGWKGIKGDLVEAQTGGQ